MNKKDWLTSVPKRKKKKNKKQCVHSCVLCVQVATRLPINHYHTNVHFRCSSAAATATAATTATAPPQPPPSLLQEATVLTWQDNFPWGPQTKVNNVQSNWQTYILLHIIEISINLCTLKRISNCLLYLNIVYCVLYIVQAIRADFKHNSSECGKSMKFCISVI